MFSPVLGRVARTASSLSPAPAGCHARAALHHTHPAVYRPSHQRRLSSSKPSSPPNSKTKPVQVEQNVTAKPQDARERQDGARKSRKTPSTSALATNMPMVRPTNHSRENVKVQSFFGRHRPISDKIVFPDRVSIENFNKIFNLDQPNNAESINHQTTQQTNIIIEAYLQRMYDAIDAQEEKRADADVFQGWTDVVHVDAPSTQQSIEEAARLPPFTPPAAPVPHDSPAAETETESFSAHEVSANIDRITEISLPVPQKERLTAFRRHVVRQRRSMLLISVRRQRKLKMKKHKYKKLMKRTRLLRRKLDRL